MYELLIQDTTTNFEERQEAVKAAKEATSSGDGPMNASVSDGVETLSFREGKLIAYTYETRRDRRGRPEREFPED
ncbi:MAG: hypothetical protein ACI9OJ_001074 [Myxococcota bacterium]|jgi:hypothetical protein